MVSTTLTTTSFDTITSFQSGTDKIYLSSQQFGNSFGNLAGGSGNQLRDKLDFFSVPTNQDYTTIGGKFSDGTSAPAIVFDSNASGGGTLYWDVDGGGNPTTGGGPGLLSVIATIGSGSVRANDIVIF
jgi:hypothetical protein